MQCVNKVCSKTALCCFFSLAQVFQVVSGVPFFLLPPTLVSLVYSVTSSPLFPFHFSSSQRLCLAVRLSFSIIEINIIRERRLSLTVAHLRLNGGSTAARHIYILHINIACKLRLIIDSNSAKREA